MATLFTMMGDPGSGKTYLSERLAERVGGVHLCADRVRSVMFESPIYSLNEHKAVFRVMQLFAEECLRQGVNVVYDANNNRRVFRKRLWDLAEGLEADYLLVRVNVPLEVALERIGTRGDGLDPAYPRIDGAVLEQIRNATEGPMVVEEMVEVEGQGSIDEQIDLILERCGEGEEQLSGNGDQGSSAATTVFLMNGLPGSGKTVFAEELARTEGAVHLCGDDLRKAMFPKAQFTDWENRRESRTASYFMDECLRRGVSVIVDAANNNHMWRQWIYEKAWALGADHLLVQVDTPKEVAWERNDLREEGGTGPFSRVPLAVFERLVAANQGPFYGEPFISVSGVEPVAAQAHGWKQRVQWGQAIDDGVELRLGRRL